MTKTQLVRLLFLLTFPVCAPLWGQNNQALTRAQAEALPFSAGGLKNISTAEVTCFSMNNGRYCDMPTLIRLGLLDTRFAGPIGTFTFTVTVDASGRDYRATARNTTRQGVTEFFASSDGVVRDANGNPVPPSAPRPSVSSTQTPSAAVPGCSAVRSGIPPWTDGSGFQYSSWERVGASMRMTFRYKYGERRFNIVFGVTAPDGTKYFSQKSVNDTNEVEFIFPDDFRVSSPPKAGRYTWRSIIDCYEQPELPYGGNDPFDYAPSGNRGALNASPQSGVSSSAGIPAANNRVIVNSDVASVRNAVYVQVTAEQFNWYFHYPGPDGIFGRTDLKFFGTAINPIGLDRSDPRAKDDIVWSYEMHVPVNRPVVLRIRSKDVLHGFSVPSLGLKEDAIPSTTVETVFLPNQTGTLEIQCAEMCGVGHERMKGVLTVESESAFNAWLASIAKQQR